MDPLSMTASIIAILQLTTTVTGYINDVRHASKEQAVVAVEASNLCSLLTSLRFRVQEARSGDPWFDQVKLLGAENGPLDQFKDTLEKMVEQMSSSRKRDQVKSALTWKFTKLEVENALKRMERLKSLIQCALTGDIFTLSQAIHSDVVTLGNQMEQLHVRTERLQHHADQDSLHRLGRWLGIPDPSTNYHAALGKRHAETGLWLVNGTQFNDWKSSESSLMWLHGNAGCGKTVLSAAALQTLLQHQESCSDTAVSYFFFDFNNGEKQLSRKAIRSLLFQFAQQVRNGLQGLEQLYQKSGSGQQQPAEDAIRSLLRDMMDRIEFKYIFLDALDECTDREDLLTFIHDLVTSKLKGLLVMATSRREKEIEEQLRPIADYNINVQSTVVDKDIQVYVRDRLAMDKKLKKWSKSVQDEITSVMMKKAHGMFRWVYCQLESIRQCVKLRALREALSSLPKTLDETYDRILRDLESRGQLPDAITALRWLCHSNRPLQLPEMVEILAIENGDDGGFFPEERLPDPADIMVVCSSLISYNAVDDDDGDSNEDDADSDISSDYDIVEDRTTEIRLAHFSVKEYLLSDRCTRRSDFQTPICHMAMAEGCLHYLLHLYKKASLTKEVIEQHPLALYAAEYWWQHAQKINSPFSPTMLSLASRLLVKEKSALLSWVQLYNVDKPWRGLDLSLTIKNVAKPLYYAAWIGVSEVVENMLREACDVNAPGGDNGSALQAASARGHETVVQVLLAAGADVNAPGGAYGSALQAASARGHETVVQVLLAAGADVNAPGGAYGSALQAASYGGHETVVQVLLAAGADVNAPAGGHYGSALQAASAGGHETVVQVLLAAGADVNAPGGDYGSALQAASYGGHQTVVQVLLAAGADVNAPAGAYGNALQAASAGDHETVVQVLLAAGADVNAPAGRDGSALRAASVRGHETVVQVLLAAGADVNAPGGAYGSALQAASARGHQTVVQVLLAAGADVNAPGGAYGSALQAASAGGHETVVQVLLAAGADVNAPGGAYGSALQAASAGGHETVVQVLLAAGADVNAPGGDYGSALQAASAGGHETVVQVLLAAGADVNAPGGDHDGNALQAASVRGHETVVQVLLAAGADVNAPGGGAYGNALQAASAGGHETVVQVLLAAGADVNAPGGDYGNALQAAGADVNAPGGDHDGNALQAASAGGHETVVQVLLAAGADVNAPGGADGSALRAASVGGHETVVQVLLAAGADVNAPGGDHDGNALQAASVGGHETVVQVLLAAGADVNALGGGPYGNALQAASVGGHETVVQVLLAAGADVNALGGGYGSALQAASARGHETVVQVLLAAGADVNAPGGGPYGSALQAASSGGHETVVQVLLAAGADVNAPGGGDYGSALQAASVRGHETAVQVLLAAGADVNAQGGDLL